MQARNKSVWDAMNNKWKDLWKQTNKDIFFEFSYARNKYGNADFFFF